jgi:hypothetical protein
MLHSYLEVDVDPGDWSRVNESPYLFRLGRGLHYEMHQTLIVTDHPQAQNGRAADRPGQDRRRRLPRHLADTKLSLLSVNKKATPIGI